MGRPRNADAPFVRLLELQHREPEGRLSRTALSDHAYRLALAHFERDPVHRPDVAHGAAQDAATDGEPHLQVLDPHRPIRRGRRGTGFAAGRGGEQVARVLVARGVEYLAGRTRFHDAAVVHHVDPVRHLAHDPEVVGDEQQGHPEAVAKLAQQREDLGLDGHVEGGGRLVRDEQIRVVREGHGDHDALALAAGQLVRIGAPPALHISEAHEVEQLKDPLAGRRGGHRPVEEKRLANLLLHGVQGIERGHRLLEDHRDAPPPEGAHRGRRRVEESFAVELDAPGRVPRLGVGEEPQHGEGGDRLARSALADEGDRFAPVHGEGRAAHRRDLLSAPAEADVQVLYGEKALRHRPHSSPPRPAEPLARRAGRNRPGKVTPSAAVRQPRFLIPWRGRPDDHRAHRIAGIVPRGAHTRADGLSHGRSNARCAAPGLNRLPAPAGADRRAGHV